MTDAVGESQDARENSLIGSSSKPTVVTARMHSEAEIFGAKRAASRRKTADNDADLKYLSELYLTPWKMARFRTHEVIISWHFHFAFRPYMRLSTALHSCVLKNTFPVDAPNSLRTPGNPCFFLRSMTKQRSMFCCSWVFELN